MSNNALVAALETKTAAAMASGAPLAARLRMVADEVRALSPVFAEAVDGFVGRLTQAEAGAEAPAVGDAFPDFVLPDLHGRLVSLAGLRKEGPVVVAFLRGHWCPYCRITAGALAEIAAKGADASTRIVAITPDSPEFARQLERDSGAAFPILTDHDNGYALSANLAIWVDAAMASLIDGAGWNVAKYQGNETWLLPIPAIFLIGRDGRVAFRHVNPDYRERADIEAMLGVLGTLR